jgi:hypothetical protein
MLEVAEDGRESLTLTQLSVVGSRQVAALLASLWISLPRSTASLISSEGFSSSVPTLYRQLLSSRGRLYHAVQ